MSSNKARHRLVVASRAPLGSEGRPGHPRSVVQKFWQLMAEGWSLEPAARECGVSMPAVTAWFTNSGGMPSVSMTPPSGRYLSLQEREEMALLVAAGTGVREIAKQLRRAPSTISRELRRNASTRSGRFAYRASTAHWHAERRARRPKTAKLVENPVLQAYVQSRLSGETELPPQAAGTRAVRTRRRRHPVPARAGCWSPEQIAHRLPIEFPEDESMRISHESIYQALRDGARCGVSWRPVCAPGGRCASRGRGPISATAGPTSHRKS
jgi:hypothetical protein